MTTQPSSQNKTTKGRAIVKQVVSGDYVIVRALNGSPPPEKHIYFSGITAPKLARRPQGARSDESETPDEAWAWEAREFLRLKLIGKMISFTCETVPNSTREYGVIFLDQENISESLVSEGLVTVRREGRSSDELLRYIELEDAAKAAGKGKWGSDPPSAHIRNVKWLVENPKAFVEQHEYKPVKAIIEQVRDGSTVRALLLPDYHYITLLLTGIRCPTFPFDRQGKLDPTVKVPFADEAKYHVETRLLQQDVEIILESAVNANFIGTILHPKGNITEFLLKEGLAQCFDSTITYLKSTDAKTLRAAEKYAKDKNLRRWKDYQASTPKMSESEREFTATVTEIVNGDALIVKKANGESTKLFISNIRPPREKDSGREPGEDGKLPPKTKSFRPLFDVPCMFDAREHLRKKLIGKKVHVKIDYIQEAKDNFPRKVCATITSNGKNVGAQLVSKGLATVLRYKAEDDQRSASYDELLLSEEKAIKSQLGVHAKPPPGPIRITDMDLNRAKMELKSLQRAAMTEAIVDFVASGSRLRLFLPKSNIICTLLLGGIECQRASRPAIGNLPAVEGEPFGDEALQFTKDHCLQRDVLISADSTDKVGNFIGWVFVDNNNLSVLLVKEGFAKVRSWETNNKYLTQLNEAEKYAKTERLRIWKDYTEQAEENNQEENNVIEEPVVKYEEVVVTEITNEGHFFVQTMAEGPKAEALNLKLRQEFEASPPIPGSFTPKRGLICAAKFSADNEWYRAKIEKVQGGSVTVHYFDYGNKETLPANRLAALPAAYSADKPFASEYVLPYVALPKDDEFAALAIKYFKDDTRDAKLYLRVLYRNQGSPPAASLHLDKTASSDLIHGLIGDGLLIVENRKERRANLNEVLKSYKEAQESAKKNRTNIWEYGDITEDDAKEFGLGK